MSNLNELQQRIHTYVNQKWPNSWEDPNMGQVFMLIISELGEAIDAHRKQRFANISKMDIKYFLDDPLTNFISLDEWFVTQFTIYIKGTVEEELADIFIRLLDYSAHEKIANLYPANWTSWNYTDTFGDYLLEITKKITGLRDTLKPESRNNFRSVRKCMIEDILFHLIEVAKMIKCEDLIQVIELKVRYNKLTISQPNEKVY